MIWVTGAALIAALLGLIWLLEKRGCKLRQSPADASNGQAETMEATGFRLAALELLQQHHVVATLNVYK